MTSRALTSLTFCLVCLCLGMIIGGLTNTTQTDRIEKLEHRVEQLEAGR